MANRALRRLIHRRRPGRGVSTEPVDDTARLPDPESGPLLLDNSPQVRHVLQAVADLARRPLSGLRVLDLACAHGEYSIELAAMGADVIGLEGRAEWLVQAEERKRQLGLDNVEFVHDDVRHLSVAKYGEFDIVLCLGILYHLDAPDVFALIDRIAEVCREFTIVETHITAPDVAYRSQTWNGHTYRGASYLEHAPEASADERLAVLGASLDNDLAFWFTEASLLNALRHAGFTSVHEVRNPVPNLFVGEQREVKIWGNRVTLAAIRGTTVAPVLHQRPATDADVDWPEDMTSHRMDDVLVHARPLPRPPDDAGADG